jgi:hypothetical protein
MQSQDPTSHPRSETMKSLYPDDLMVSAFGTVTPTIEEKTTYFFKKWCDWRENAILLSELGVHTYDSNHIIALCDTIGLKYLWHYQLRDRQLRFYDNAALSFFKIAASNKFQKGTQHV